MELCGISDLSVALLALTKQVQRRDYEAYEDGAKLMHDLVEQSTLKSRRFFNNCFGVHLHLVMLVSVSQHGYVFG